MKRAEKVCSSLDKAGLPGLLVTYLPNVRYLSGFTGSSAALLLTAEKRFLITDFRYVTQADIESPGWEVVKREGKLAPLLEQLGVEGRLGFEAEHLSVSSLGELASSEKIVWEETKGLVEEIRMIKDEEEAARLEAAQGLLDHLMEETLHALRPGREEREVAAEFVAGVFGETGHHPPFDPIVASGVRGAMPHGIASEKTIERGELVTLDLGLVLDGYAADMTRTASMGPPDGRAVEIHDLVRLANRAAYKGIRPGMDASAAHGIAAGIMEGSGYGEYFGHGLGHGLGVEVHEAPRISPSSGDKLVEGMAFTIEPGIYIPGWGGVRIEDSGLLLADGMRIFSSLPREIFVAD